MVLFKIASVSLLAARFFLRFVLYTVLRKKSSTKFAAGSPAQRKTLIHHCDSQCPRAQAERADTGRTGDANGTMPCEQRFYPTVRYDRPDLSFLNQEFRYVFLKMGLPAFRPRRSSFFIYIGQTLEG
jgi:hypothetical protein